MFTIRSFSCHTISDFGLYHNTCKNEQELFKQHLFPSGGILMIHNRRINSGSCGNFLGGIDHV
jgi:hypothetical protein